MTHQDKIDKMLQGDKAILKQSLESNNAILRMIAIINCTKFKINDNETIKNIKMLVKDSSFIDICGFKVCEVAIASLHLLKVERYQGEDNSILRLIKSNLEF